MAPLHLTVNVHVLHWQLHRLQWGHCLDRKGSGPHTRRKTQGDCVRIKLRQKEKTNVPAADGNQRLWSEPILKTIQLSLTRLARLDSSECTSSCQFSSVFATATMIFTGSELTKPRTQQLKPHPCLVAWLSGLGCWIKASAFQRFGFEVQFCQVFVKDCSCKPAVAILVQKKWL